MPVWCLTPHVLLDSDPLDRAPATQETDDAKVEDGTADEPGNVVNLGRATADSTTGTNTPPEPKRPMPIFVSHGKKRAPLEKLQKILTSFGIPAQGGRGGGESRTPDLGESQGHDVALLLGDPDLHA